MKPIFKIENIKKSFGKKEVLKGVDFEIAKAEKIAILGPNGSGKSTLINIMVGLLKQSEGEVLRPLYKNEKEFFKDLGIQFQDRRFPKGYTLEQLFNLVYELRQPKKKDEDNKAYIARRDKEKAKMIKLFQLVGSEKTKVNKLSGGQQQRLSILLSIVHKPKVLILDELTTGLDVGSQYRLVNYIKKYSEKKDITLIVISHIVFEISSLADRVILLDKGTIQHDIQMNELVKKYKSVSNYMESYFVRNEKLKGGK